jgi:hypothetical protein
MTAFSPLYPLNEEYLSIIFLSRRDAEALRFFLRELCASARDNDFF